MYPVSETVEVNGSIPLQRHGADIQGLTSTERTLAEVCEWVHPGGGATAAAVFPNAAGSAIETPGMLVNLLAWIFPEPRLSTQS